MTDANRQWQDIKASYLKQIEKCLADVDHPQRTDILANVAEHLDTKYAELTAVQQNWDSFQQIITEMGPPREYADLLSETTLPAEKRILGINTLLAAVFVIVLISVGGYLIYTAKNAPPPPSPTPVPNAFEFESDERVLGKWVTVDFVRNIGNFKPKDTRWSGDLYLKDLTFYEDGTTSGPWEWTKGRLFHPGDHTGARYVINDMQGVPYLFIEWISGDVTIRGQEPWYYVLRKEE
jgi:hypothetical protein